MEEIERTRRAAGLAPIAGRALERPPPDPSRYLPRGLGGNFHLSRTQRKSLILRRCGKIGSPIHTAAVLEIGELTGGSYETGGLTRVAGAVSRDLGRRGPDIRLRASWMAALA